MAKKLKILKMFYSGSPNNIDGGPYFYTHDSNIPSFHAAYQ